MDSVELARRAVTAFVGDMGDVDPELVRLVADAIGRAVGWERQRVALLAGAVGATFKTTEPNPDGPGEVVGYHDFADLVLEPVPFVVSDVRVRLDGFLDT